MFRLVLNRFFSKKFSTESRIFNNQGDNVFKKPFNLIAITNGLVCSCSVWYYGTKDYNKRLEHFSKHGGSRPEFEAFIFLGPLGGLAGFVGYIGWPLFLPIIPLYGYQQLTGPDLKNSKYSLEK